MAWIDNRAWCHPTIAGLSDKAYRVWTHGLQYASGWVTKGQLNPAAQQLIGSTPKIRRELENAGLWIDDGPTVIIKGWEEHNGERDRKAAERKEYMRDYQAKRRANNPQGSNTPVNVDVNVDITPLTDDRVTDDSNNQTLGHLIDLNSVLRGVV